MNNQKRVLLSVIANVHGYFVFCFLYFLILYVRGVIFTPHGEIIYQVMFNFLIPLFGAGPLILFLFVKRINIIRRNIIVISMVALTIIIFELVLIE